MSYFNGSVNDANAAKLIALAIDNNITSEPGISRVTANIVSSNLTWNVYKSDGNVNEKGADFYFAIGYPQVAMNSIVFTVMESWNTTSNQASNYAPVLSGCVPAANYANPRAATNLPANSSCMAYLQTQNLVAVQAWGVSATANRVVVFTGNTGSWQMHGYYLGLYDPFLSAADDPFPLICANMQYSGTNATALNSAPTTIGGFATREPKTTSGNSTNFATAQGGGGSSNAWTGGSSPGTADVYLGQHYVNRVVSYGRSASAIRGLLKDLYSGPVQTANGDTITWTLNGVNYDGVRVAASAFGVYCRTV